MPDQFLTDLAARLDSLRLETSESVSGWCVALSGGMDSQALLHAILRLNPPEPVRAIHIHHGLSANADDWLQHCQAYCDKADIPLTCQRVEVNSSGKGIEDAARFARYQVFERQLAANEVLLQGHHLDDQCETLMLRMLRGSGAAGLSGMPESRALGSGCLFRPLLHTNRQQIEAFAQMQKLHWVEDESNASDLYDRNYIRHSVLPQIEKRWPEYRQPLQQVMSVAQEQQELLLDLAKIDLQTVALQHSWGEGLKGLQRSVQELNGVLSVAALIGLSARRRHNLLRYWLALQGLTQPRTHQWTEIDRLLHARQDASPQVCWPGGDLRRFKDGLYPVRALPQLAETGLRLQLDANQGLVKLPLGYLGYKRSPTFSGDHCILRLKRSGDEFKPLGRSRKSLKKYLQEMDVPPWIRSYVPVIESNDRLLWVAGLGVAEEAGKNIAEAAFVWRDFN